jgi:uncharacterized cupredoxin-like copper-binding protein
MKITKDVLKSNIKHAISVVVLVAMGTIGFQSGRAYQKYVKVAEKVENPYAHAFSPEEISIAVNESGELIMIERATGKYIVYSDSIGQTIFGMYANRIHQEVSDVSK